MNEQYQKYISKEEINSLPLLEYRGKIEVIENSEHALRAITELRLHKTLGFDTETRPSFNKGESYQVALLQLATDECAYLFRLSKMAFPKELADLLADEYIVKAGVAIHDDLKGLQKLHPFKPGGFVDLSVEVKKLGFTSLGLRALAAIFLKQRLSKGAKVTNWERTMLTEPQIKYAANDARVGLEIYHKLIGGGTTSPV